MSNRQAVAIAKLVGASKVITAAAVGYNLLFGLLVVAIAALLVLIATSFEGIHLDTTGGPGRIL